MLILRYILLFFAILLTIVNLTLSYNFDNFYTEIIISFLPFLLALELSYLLVLLTFLITKKLLFFENIKGLYEVHLIKVVAVIVLLLTFTTLFLRFISFSFIPYSSTSLAKSDGKSLKVAFFNKKYNNNNYSEISKIIQKLDPDVIAFAEGEYSLNTKIQYLEKYNYFTESLNEPNFPVKIYSKYELVNINNDFDFDGVLATIFFNEKQVNIFAVHPIAPISQDELNYRNKSLINICNTLKRFGSYQTILVGDFNTTPWSNNYEIVSNCLKGFQNLAKGKGINFTWSGSIIKNTIPLNVHIDHAFITKDLSLTEFKILEKYGSDHNMLFFEVLISN